MSELPARPGGRAHSSHPDESAAPARNPEPVSTYRLQLGPGLGFAAAAGLVGYLGDLGVSHLYLSPVLQARPGSTHGYDVADPTRVSEDLGGEDGLRALAAAAHAAGMGVVVDIVPNHLGTGFATPLWRTLLAEGHSGAAGAVFDVDWATPLPGATGKVVVPVLGDQYGAVLHRGELEVVEEDGELRLAYHEHRFPLSEESGAAVRRAGGPAELVGHPEEPDRYLRLHALLEMQHYRLVHWRAGQALVNYRRFFSIDELAGVRVEDPRVFDLTQDRILALVRDGVVDGLRIDHPDGLRHPARYLDRLAERSGGVWTVVEKITAPGEPLRDWPVAGTSGYEFCNQVLGLFVDPAAAPALDALDAELGGDPRPYGEQVEAAKRAVLAGELAADVRRLARQLWAVTAEHPEVRDVDDRDCLAALTDVAVALDVYRTFVDPETGAAAPEDVARVEAAVARARRAGPEPLYGFLAQLLTGRAGTSAPHLDLLARVQQLTGALTAKGVEDTVFYRYRRLLAVNEVGGEPGHLGLDAAGFHVLARQRAERHPAGLLATATHDTKRGEDARLRIAALSELPERWAADVRRWQERHGAESPDPQTALLLYQTLVAVWPVDGAELAPVRARVGEYLVKASREAKQRTSWRDPDEAFEAAAQRFLDRLLDDPQTRAELADLARAAADVAVVSGLAQVLLRVSAPGVPDTYQGTEVWDLSLVDPDNRRPVDFAARRAALAALDAEGADPGALFAAPHDGRVKTWVLSRALRARRERAAALRGYAPLEVTGDLAGHVVAFARTGGDGGAALVALAPRLPGAVLRRAGGSALGAAWGNTAVALPDPGPWLDRLSGTRHDAGAALALSDAFAALPVALLTRP
jgi:malto-oligosyltrehalose synthase